MLRGVDLFSGIGGFAVAAEGVGCETVAFAEVAPYPSAVLAARWPAVPNLGDVRGIDGRGLRERFGRIDYLCGGFPCQDISVAGRGAGLGSAAAPSARSGLWWELSRVVRELRPDWVLIENVPALRARGADVVLADLEQHGYAVWPTVVGAWAVGAPHRRERVWILGRLADAERARLEGQRSVARQSQVAGVGGDGGGGRWPAGYGAEQHEWEPPRLVESGVGGVPDGLPADVARLLGPGGAGWSADRIERWWTVNRRRIPGRRRREQVRALGNAIVPQVAQAFFAFMVAIASGAIVPPPAGEQWAQPTMFE